VRVRPLEPGGDRWRHLTGLGIARLAARSATPWRCWSARISPRARAARPPCSTADCAIWSTGTSAWSASLHERARWRAWRPTWRVPRFCSPSIGATGGRLDGAAGPLDLRRLCRAGTPVAAHRGPPRQGARAGAFARHGRFARRRNLLRRGDGRCRAGGGGGARCRGARRQHSHLHRSGGRPARSGAGGPSFGRGGDPGARPARRPRSVAHRLGGGECDRRLV
jgi:hypothetical protein